MAKVEIRETVTASVSPEVLWEALFDPLPLHDCLPGATVFERIGEHEYRLVIELSNPVIHGSYSGTFHVAEHTAYDHFRLAAKASGPLGKVRAIADVTLTPLAAKTRAAIVIRADLSGVLGFVGPPAAGLVGRWMVDKFFECIDRSLLNRAKGGCTDCGGSTVGNAEQPVSKVQPSVGTRAPTAEGMATSAEPSSSSEPSKPAPASLDNPTGD